ncbi:MAG: MobC family plasmid mobilization relaxosome protein [Oscillospiraceae bacterium]|nr:MobC family plasmid mobilization relaxosome protein [Oscillospiraceae bacterium]
MSGHTTEQFIRNLIAGVEMRRRPPDEMADILRQLSAIGNNINQIARAANARGFVRQEELNQITAMQSEIWHMVKRL